MPIWNINAKNVSMLNVKVYYECKIYVFWKDNHCNYNIIFTKLYIREFKFISCCFISNEVTLTNLEVCGMSSLIALMYTSKYYQGVSLS